MLNKSLIPRSKYPSSQSISYPIFPNINTRKIDTTVITLAPPWILELFPANPRRKNISWKYQVIAGSEAFLYFARSYEQPTAIPISQVEIFRNSSFSYLITSAAFTTGVLEQYIKGIQNPVSLVITGGGGHRLYISEILD